MSKRSRRERLWLLAVFVLVSTLVTLHLGHRLPWPHKHGILGSLVEDVEREAISSTEHLAVLRDIKRIPPSRHLESPGHDVYHSPGDDDNLSSSSDYQPQSNDAMIENKKIITTIYDNNNNDRDNNTDNYNNNNNNNNDNNNSNNDIKKENTNINYNNNNNDDKYINESNDKKKFVNTGAQTPHHLAPSPHTTLINDIKKENTNINYNNNNNDDKYINESNDKKKFVNTGAQTPHHLAPSPHTTLINSPSHKQRNLHIIKRHHQGEENEFDDRGTDKDRKHYNAITRTTNTTTNTYNNNNNNVYYNIKGKNSGSSFTNWTYIKVKGKRRRHSPFTTLLDSRYNKNSDKTNNNNNNNKGKDNNNNDNPDPHKRDRLEILTAITTILQQIENETLLPVDTSRPLVVVEGGLSAVKQHFPLVESAFHKYKMAASFRAVDDGGDKVPLDNKEKVTTTTTTPSSPDIGSWSVLMCLNTTDSTANGCVVSAIRAGTKPYQKVNVIPNLSIPARTACDTRQSDSHTPDNDDHTRHVSGKWYGGDLPCVILASPLSSSPPPPPSSSSSASSSSSSSSKPTSFRCHESSGSWIVLEEGEGEGTMDGIRGPGGKKRTNRFIPCGDEMMGRQHQEWWTENVVTGPSPNNRTVIIQVPLPPRLLTPKFSTEGIVWQVYMLVTSLSPLRAYLHPSGIVWEGMEAYINRKLPRKVTLLDIHQLISDLDTEEQATKSLNWVEDSLKRSLLFMESQALKRNRSFSRYFQLFEGIVIFNSTFHPLVIEINPTTYVDGLSSLSKYLVEQNILEDLAAMLSSRVSVSKDIGKILTEFGMAEVEQRGVCLTSSDFCLSESDLVHLMDTRREHGASRNWLRLCPSTSKSCYPELSSLQKPVTRHSGHRVTPGFSHAPMPPFPQMFPSLVEAVESAFQGSEVGDERVDVYEDDVNFPLEQEQWERDDVDIEPSNMFNTSYTQSPRPCDNDSASLQYLSAIHTHPRLILHPEFTPLTTDYYTHVSHDTLLISIRAVAKHCKAAALLEDRRHAMNRWVNFTLGVGENTAHVMVVEMDERLSGWTLNTYKIRIYRRENNQHLGNVDGMGVKHQVCGLSQHCSLPFSTTAPCGLQHLNKYQSWAQLVQQQIELKQCGLYEGQWMVPCANCSHSNSCNWKVAMWGSEACQEKQLSMESVHSCFKDRKILFVGDSTLRGISHYLMEKVNGSLQEWDKTHNIKVYTSLAGGDTTVGFAYYPQFWLPVHKRPSLGVALKKLIGRAAPLVNSSRTVLALGGVHWLGRHHIDVLMTTLASEGLTGIQVIVKGLGAGFHQPISSMHHLTLTDHEKLLVQNQAVLSYALTKGFQVVDTFNMTMARYTEFLQGKCACHFQRVARERMSIWSRLTHTASTSDTAQPRFHVEGDVGIAYSEMMINRMCGGGA